MKRPVFSFEAELLTDAPYEHIVGRLRINGPSAFKSLRSLSTWAAPEAASDRLVLRWVRLVMGARESGEITLAPHPRGAHLRIEGRMKGWAAFLLFGLLRWRTDRLLDRFVEEL